MQGLRRLIGFGAVLFLWLGSTAEVRSGADASLEAQVSLGPQVSLRAQVPGIAEITDPAEGQALHGIVSIFGTASHPAFETFELAFSFDPDPTDTWFPIGEALETSVVDGRLAVWDTNKIADGEYRLRLVVSLDGADPIATVITGLRVRNYSPTEIPAPAAITEIPVPEPPLPQEPDAPIDSASVEQPADPPSRLQASLRLGAIVGVGLMFSLLIYLWLAPRVRAYAGHLRMRQHHQRQDRARQRGRRRG